MLAKTDFILGKFNKAIGTVCMVFIVLMIFNICYNVVARYVFNTGSIAMQELEWHFFSAIILLGMSYTLSVEQHVRVDIFYANFSIRKKAIVDILGGCFFILPISLLILINGSSFSFNSYDLGEISPDPGGLPYRWIVKGLIPLSFLTLLISLASFFIKNILILKKENSK